MALEKVVVITKFIDVATVWILAFVYNAAGVLVDPSGSIKVTIWDPDGGDPVLDGQAMTKYDSETGIYEYSYHKGVDTAPMDKGEWRGRVDVIDGEGNLAVISPQSFSFKVE